MAATVAFASIEFHPDFRNSRKRLGDVEGLKESIKSAGLQNPLTVLEMPERKGEETCNKLYLIAGFRRYEAIRQIRGEDPNAFKEVPVAKRQGSLAEAHFINLIENVQREDLTPLEIADSVEYLLNLGYKQTEISKKIGKSQTWVSNALAFKRQAVPQLQEAVNEGKVSFVLGQQIATLPDKEQRSTVKKIINGDSREKKPTSQAEIRKEIREASGRPIRPTTAEVRHEIARLDEESSKNKLDDFSLGVWTALKWLLGERKTLRRPT